MVVLSYCSCKFHKSCLQKFVREELRSLNLQIECPSARTRNSNEKCKMNMLYEDLNKFMSDELWMQHQTANLRHAVESKNGELAYCPTKDCGNVMPVDKDKAYIITCNWCKIKNCMICKVPYHEDVTCKDYQDLNPEVFRYNKQTKQAEPVVSFTP